jgi:hypothetical protein
MAPLRMSLGPGMGGLQDGSVQQAAKVWADSLHRSAVPHLQQLAAGLGSLQR